MAHPSANCSQTSVGGASTCSQGGLEGIAELLRCYICMGELHDTTLCPHCCKLVCFSCIKRWITDTRSDCPHCRMPLTVRELVKMQLFDDLVKFMEDLRSKQEDAIRLPSNEIKTCPSHSQKLSVYCVTCAKSICHECALWSSEHKGHNFKPRDEMYAKHKLAVESELYKLKDRMKDILSYVLQVEQKVESVKVNKSKTKREFQQVLEKEYSRLDMVTKEKLTKLADCRHFLRSQAVKVMRAAHDLEKKIVTGSYSSLLNSEGEMKKDFRDSLDKLYSNSFKMDALSTAKEIPNEVVPQHDSALFEIHPFKELQVKGEEIYSPPLKVGGLTWRLKIYPNGHHEDIGRYLAVFMELSEGFAKSTNYQYSIEILYNCSDKYPQRNYSKDYSSEFGDGECWGYRKYFELSKLHSEGYLKDDTLVLRFKVRHLSYYDKCKDLSLYVDRILTERDALQQQLKEAQRHMTVLKSENKKLTSASRPKSSPHHSRTDPRGPRHVSPKSSHSHPPLVHHQHARTHSNPLESPGSTHHTHLDDLRRAATTSYGISALQQVVSPPHHTSTRKSAMHLGRRKSHDTNMDNRSLIEQRRRSADPAVNYDPTLKRESGSDTGGESGDGSRHMKMGAHRSHGQFSESHRFEDSSSDHSSSQTLNTDDIYLGVTDYGNGSSTSTLTAAGSSSQPYLAVTNKLSQAEFADEDPNDLYHNPLDIELQSTEMGVLSQPSSPPKSVRGKSLTDIHTIGNGTLSHSQQFLSQSIADFPQYHHWDRSGTYYTMADSSRQDRTWFHDGRFLRPVAKPALSTSHGQIYRMCSDPYLNYDPGSHAIKSSQLKKVTEEEEQKSTRSRQQQNSQRGSQQKAKVLKGQQLGKKHLKATVVSETSVRNQIDKARSATSAAKSQLPSIAIAVAVPPQLPSTDSSSTLAMETLSVKTESISHSSEELTSRGKSNSASSLNNLSQIL